LLVAYGWLLAETDDACEILKVECCTSCTTESKEPLHSLLLAFAPSGWLTANVFLSDYKILLYSWMASFTYML